MCVHLQTRYSAAILGIAAMVSVGLSSAEAGPPFGGVADKQAWWPPNSNAAGYREDCVSHLTTVKSACDRQAAWLHSGCVAKAIDANSANIATCDEYLIHEKWCQAAFDHYMAHCQSFPIYGDDNAGFRREEDTPKAKPWGNPDKK